MGMIIKILFIAFVFLMTWKLLDFTLHIISTFISNRRLVNSTIENSGPAECNNSPSKKHQYLSIEWIADNRLSIGGYRTGCCIHCQHLKRISCRKKDIVDFNVKGVDADLFDRALIWGSENAKSKN